MKIRGIRILLVSSRATSLRSLRLFNLNRTSFGIPYVLRNSAIFWALLRRSLYLPIVRVFTLETQGRRWKMKQAIEERQKKWGQKGHLREKMNLNWYSPTEVEGVFPTRNGDGSITESLDDVNGGRRFSLRSFSLSCFWNR